MYLARCDLYVTKKFVYSIQKLKFATQNRIYGLRRKYIRNYW